MGGRGICALSLNLHSHSPVPISGALMEATLPVVIRSACTANVVTIRQYFFSPDMAKCSYNRAQLFPGCWTSKAKWCLYELHIMISRAGAYARRPFSQSRRLTSAKKRSGSGSRWFTIGTAKCFAMEFEPIRIRNFITRQPSTKPLKCITTSPGRRMYFVFCPLSPIPFSWRAVLFHFLWF
ncbi:hypothetical protein BDN70DRAFT_561426 [Pholiota conissans]|uniref:Uncharacterized protein n=1 Tax=Pholiota conissans TaxID=109636 RepID=A0A9P5Z6R0_9AGAR|nr:hypothetical protein BDN70DRAFT_561426 [Pholiota conissans]